MSTAVTVEDMRTDRSRSKVKGSKTPANRESDGAFLVQDLDSVEDLGEINVVPQQLLTKSSHHLVIREFPTWIDPPKSGLERRSQENMHSNAGNQIPVPAAFGSQHNVHYLNQFLNQLGSLPFDKSGKRKLRSLSGDRKASCRERV